MCSVLSVPTADDTAVYTAGLCTGSYCGTSKIRVLSSVNDQVHGDRDPGLGLNIGWQFLPNQFYRQVYIQ